MVEIIKEKIEHKDSLPNLADALVLGVKNLLCETRTEEELRIGFEKLLEPIKTALNLNYTPKYERSVYSGRSDAVHGQVIIEYEPPRSLSSKKNIDHAYNQLVRYLSDQTEATGLTQLIGVGFDGEKVFFVQYQDRNNKQAKFLIRGPYEFNTESAKTFLIHLRALSRLPLTANNLAEKFGPQGELAPKMVSALTNALEHWGNQTNIHTFFNEWKRLFGIVYGEQITLGHQEKVANTLSKLYRVKIEIDFQGLLFSVHTYFVFLMKLIVAELLTLRETSFSSSLASQIVHIADNQLQRQLEDIEDGGIYIRRGITNFLEGDFFRWYLSALESPELKDAIRETARALSEFEPATSTLDPTSTCDLLKRLYQYLVPQEVRHCLGEYYTPDWLAELVLNEVGYNGNTLKRLLDPACGSGTFLVLAIQRAKVQGEKEKLPPLEIAKRIVTNIWGFDLNPLAVIAARTNYLFALGDLVNELPHIEIPVYLCDSILTPTRTMRDLFGEFLEVSTSVGRFKIPSEWVKDGGFLLTRAAPVVEEMVKNQYTLAEAIKRLQKEGLVFTNNQEVVKNFYTQILELEGQNKNGIWARFLKNAFAPMFAGRFDFVVGNPPWVRWGYLSGMYRKATLKMWKDYGLFSLKGHAARLGGGEKDFSMLFVYASADYYLKDRARLGFLITQEVFKSKGAGEGFRRFQLGEGKYLKVLKAHDLASIQPFEGATNKTAAIVLKKGEKTEYPLPYIVWTKKRGVSKIATDKLLEEVLPFLQKKKLTAQPIGNQRGAWQTSPVGQRGVNSIKGKNYYIARQGADPQPYGVFLIEVKGKLSDESLLINNLYDSGKFKVPTVAEKIETDLVYPALRGFDIERWRANLSIFILLTQDPQKREPHPDSKMKSDWPKTFNYLIKFKDVLLSRRSKPIRDLMTRSTFYAMYGIGLYTISPYKVVWKFMSNDIFATVVTQSKTLFGYKTVIPTKTVAFFATDSESEAHYLCAIINSQPVRNFIKSFSSAGRGFGTPSVMEHVGIPRFDPTNPIHQRLAEISKECHQLKSEGKDREIEELEKENDALVKRLWGIK